MNKLTRIDSWPSGSAWELEQQDQPQIGIEKTQVQVHQQERNYMTKHNVKEKLKMKKSKGNKKSVTQ